MKVSTAIMISGFNNDQKMPRDILRYRTRKSFAIKLCKTNRYSPCHIFIIFHSRSTSYQQTIISGNRSSSGPNWFRLGLQRLMRRLSIAIATQDSFFWEMTVRPKERETACFPRTVLNSVASLFLGKPPLTALITSQTDRSGSRICNSPIPV